MIHRLLVLFLVLHPLNAAEINPFLREFPAAGKLEFKLEDKLRMPSLSWPRTLLGYAVRFDSPPDASALRLVDLISGKEVPFQLSDTRGNIATISFFSDLPTGGIRRFELSRGKPSATPPGVKRTEEAGVIVLDAGKLKVRLPATQAVNGKVSGPILGLNRFGESTLVSPKHPVKSITTETIESGPLFITCRVTYQFEGGGCYIATVRAIADYEYVEFNEEMTGLSKDDGIFVEMAWTNFNPTHHMTMGSPFGGVRKLGEPMIQPFRGEDPSFTGPSRIEDPAVEMLPSLTPYWPNGWGGNRSASFWDEKSGEAMGLFITDASKWQDHEYAIWTSADTLRVKYRFDQGRLYWKWPLATGHRATGLTVYQHMAPVKPPELADQKPGSTWKDEVDAASDRHETPVRLQVRYGDISLDRVKDWVLDYPETAPKPPASAMKPGRQKSVESYMEALPKAALMDVARGMFHPVGLRDMGYWVVPDFLRFREEMTAEQRSQASAALLFAAYVAAEDEYAPMRTMLGGHPNFMADLKFPIAAAAFLFPAHPMAAEWRDQFGKFLELCGRYFVRPAVPAWESLGGRFTESIATYQWAFLGPVCEANRLGQITGARNLLADPKLADMGDYLVGILTSPQSATKKGETGSRRIHPPQGAHSSKRGAPGSMYELGEQLHRYRPLTAEHLMWGGFSAAGKGFEDRPGDRVDGLNHGTNPHLQSAKYTGYGIVLRAGVDTPDEISVFLQQIDKGPNYRWGYANQNGSGNLYYYAGGNSYSGHEREEAGDGHVDDAWLSSNTGVYKDWGFRSIGMNELTQPLYDLGAAQFAELLPESGPGAYSWPEYRSRGVMLVGTDYIIVHDRIREPCGTRFAWNICRDDVMPVIQRLRGSEGTLDLTDPKDGFVRGSLSTMIKGGGSHLALVTHRPDVQVVNERRPRGAVRPPYVRLKTAASDDHVFAADDDVVYQDKGMTFSGRAGLIRQHGNGTTELALFLGTRIGTEKVSLEVDNPELGISATFREPAEISGRCFSRNGGTLKLTAVPGGRLFVDAVEIPPAAGVYRIPPGDHRLEYTRRLPEPMPPSIRRTENRAGGATVFFTKAAGAENHRIELSSDHGTTWTPVGETAGDRFNLTGLTDGTKVHIRAVALNRERESRPANEYPLYVTAAAPPPPDGLAAEPGPGKVRLTWGEVLGAGAYKLYRRSPGEAEFKEIFRGLANEFIDTVDCRPAFAEPGLKAAALRHADAPTVHQYAVAAINGNGEGARSLTVDTDPRAWDNWKPAADLRFKRRSGFWLPPYVREIDVPPAYYPD
jgi:hypothetical protein